MIRFKALLRNAWWSFKGIGTRNPATPRRVESVLFVCLGNICRSPFGAELAKRLLAEAGRDDVRCASAGIRPSQAARSPREACRVSAAYGLSLDEHEPQPLTRELMASHDVVFVMERAQLERLRAEYPEFRDRVFLLSLFDDEAGSAYERYNIADPFGQPLTAYEACYERIERAIRAWLPVRAA